MDGRTDYFGSTQAIKLWDGKKTATTKLSKKQALELARSLRRAVVGTGKRSVEMCLHKSQKHITIYSHEV